MAKRGLQQGDPLLPFLFTIVGDAFSNLVRYCNERRVIEGFSFGSLSTKVTHLQYVDDTLIFCSWSDGNLMAWWSIVNLLLSGSGLSLNVSKMSFIGVNLSFEETDFNASILGCKVNNFPFNYLGFPIGGKHATKVACEALKENFKMKIDK